MASQPIYQFYAELCDYEPKIWRRFQTLQNISVARLGYITMILFEMTASHLFSMNLPARENQKKHSANKKLLRFYPKDICYEIINEYTEDFGRKNIEDAVKTKLYHAMRYVGDDIFLNYDFGDGWEVKITVEKIFNDDSVSGKDLPRVLEGDGYGIIEDCGGTGGLESLAKAFKKRSGQDYETFAEWLGVTELNLESFDIKDMNFRVKKIPRIYADCYEKDLEPTIQSMKLIAREYLK